MARESDDLWNALARSGESVATEEDYEHGYKREVRGDLQQYVAFRVSGEIYGLAITEISEISMLFDTTPVPRTAEFVVGIGSVRGIVIPILDLALRLRIAPEPRGGTTRVLIVRHEDELYGLIVDGVIGVVTLAPEDLEDAPGVIAGSKGEFIRALSRLDDEILIVLELSTLLAARDFIQAQYRVASREVAKGGNE